MDDIATSYGSTIADFEKAAASEGFLDLDCVFYYKFDCPFQAGRELVRSDYPVPDLEALTKHRDPRVRTLALVGLFQKRAHKLLPVIFALVDDDAPTFPARTRERAIDPAALRRLRRQDPPSFVELPQTPQSVGAVAEGLVTFYLKQAGYRFRSYHGTPCFGFPHYWEQCKDRDYLASWFAVELHFAARDPVDAARALAALRSRLDALEGEDRLWYSLFVGTSEWGDRIFSKADLLAVGQALGPDQLMLMLASRAPASDPDLVLQADTAKCADGPVGGRMRAFVLGNAAALLRPEDADALLESAKVHDLSRAIAAAMLRPDLAESILKGALARVDGNYSGGTQAILAVALVRLGGT